MAQSDQFRYPHRPWNAGCRVYDVLTGLQEKGQLACLPLLLGHRKLEITVRYLGIEGDGALKLSEQIEL